MTATVDADRLFRMPTLGADMTEGRVAQWLVAPGTEVRRGDLVAVIETDKSDIEVEVFEPCVFEEFLVDIGELVAVGTPIARIRPLDATAAEETHAAVVTPATLVAEPMPPPVVPPPPVVSVPAPVAGASTARRLTPRARRLAQQQGIDLEVLPAEGTITGDDVLGLATATAGPSSAPPRAPESMRRAIASLMETSWRSIPHYHVGAPLDVTDAEERLAASNRDRPPADRVLLGALLNVAIARAAAEVPECNGWWRGDAFVPATSVDLGMVVSLRTGGVLVPTIVDADRLTPTEMMARMRELVERARRGRLRGSDLGEASITVTSIGESSARTLAGVIHPPQVALVGLGGVGDEAVVHDGEIRRRRIVHATVAGDHRAHDGLSGARLLDRLRHHLEDLP